MEGLTVGGGARIRTTARHALLFDDPVRELSENMGARLAAYTSGRTPAPVVPIWQQGE